MKINKTNGSDYYPCPKCNGSKIDSESFSEFSKYMDKKILINKGLFMYCNHCKGHGCVDWINNTNGQSRDDEIEDYNDKDIQDIYNIIAALKFNLIPDYIEEYKELDKAIDRMKSRLVITIPPQELDIFDDYIENFLYGVGDFLINDYIPYVSNRFGEYINYCIELTACLRLFDYLYEDILEKECICVNQGQIDRATKMCKVMGIDIDDEDCAFDSLDGVIDWCISIARNSIGYSRYSIDQCDRIKTAFRNKKDF